MGIPERKAKEKKIGRPFAQSGKLPKSDGILGEWINAQKDARLEIYLTDNKYYRKMIGGAGGDTKDSKNPDAYHRSS